MFNLNYKIIIGENLKQKTIEKNQYKAKNSIRNEKKNLLKKDS